MGMWNFFPRSMEEPTCTVTSSGVSFAQSSTAWSGKVGVTWPR